MPKNILISGYYGFDNFGDEAILGVLVDKLLSMGHNICVISGNPKKTSYLYSVNSVKNTNYLGILAEIIKSDVLISGGGSLLQDVTSFKSLVYYSGIIKLAQAFKKKVVIFAQGIGPLFKPKSKEIVKSLVCKSDIVTVRDEKSLALVKSWGCEATLVNDPVFSLEIMPTEHKGVVGVQLRKFKTLSDDFLNMLAIHILNEFPDRKIELYAFQKTMDLDICKQFEKLLKSINPEVETEIIHSLSRNDFIFRMLDLEYMVAMRYHAVLMALKLGIKTMALNYDAKVMKLAYEAFIPLLTMNVEDDFKTRFQYLRALNPQNLMKFANSKPFDWLIFSQILN